MGKIKNALIAWNEDNGYEASQISGWEKKPKLTDLIEFDWDKKKTEVDFEQLKNKAEYIKKLSEHG